MATLKKTEDCESNRFKKKKKGIRVFNLTKPSSVYCLSARKRLGSHIASPEEFPQSPSGVVFS